MFSFLEKSAFDGYRVVAGIDEAGRGPLAGPVAAAAVCVGFDWIPAPRSGRGQVYAGMTQKIRRFAATNTIRDSKCLSAKQREEIFEALKDIPGIEWRVSFVQPKTIDRINIWQATLLAWRRCLKKLSITPDFLFIDGNMAIPRLKIKQSPIVKGDQKIFLVSLASIIAKVSRDRLMDKLDRKYPEYGFSQHKGYGTKLHLERLEKFGPCPIHRRSFKPVFDNLSFCDRVYYAVGRIPRGQIMTYKDVAWQIGQPNAFRAVGNVLNRNFDPKIPCHRVVRSDGKIGGYNRGGELKKELLRKENCSRRTVLLADS